MVHIRLDIYILIWNFRSLPVSHSSAKTAEMKSSMVYLQSDREEDYCSPDDRAALYI